MRAVTVVSCLAMLVACSPAEGPPGAPSVSPAASVSSPAPPPSPAPSPSPSPSPPPSPSPSPTVVESYPTDLPTGDPESAAIIAGWQEYQRVLEKFAVDPLGFSDFSETQYVTTGEAANVILDEMQMLRNERLRSEGGLVFRDVTLTIIGTGESGAREATLDYCLDVNALRVFYVDTGEQLPRSGTYTETTTMEQGADAKWRVSRIRNSEASC